LFDRIHGNIINAVTDDTLIASKDGHNEIYRFYDSLPADEKPKFYELYSDKLADLIARNDKSKEKIEKLNNNFIPMNVDKNLFNYLNFFNGVSTTFFSHMIIYMLFNKINEFNNKYNITAIHDFNLEFNTPAFYWSCQNMSRKKFNMPYIFYTDKNSLLAFKHTKIASKIYGYDTQIYGINFLKCGTDPESLEKCK
jgi:hypothetical protein